MKSNNNNHKERQNNAKEFYTPREVAEILRVDVKTIYAWMDERKLPYYRFIGAVRIPVNRFEEWKENHYCEIYEN